MGILNKDTVYVYFHNVESNTPKINQPYGLIALILIFLLFLLNLKKLKHFFERIKPSNYKLNLLGFEISGNLKYKSSDQEIAWKIYIELITRVTGNQLDDDTGILRESLNSLYIAFQALREILKNGGAELASLDKKNTYSVASLLLIVMNQHLRPFLSKWHPLLLDHEKSKLDNVSQVIHENNWEFNLKFRSELKLLKNGLNQYIVALKEIAQK